MTAKMNPEVKALWVEALRSGDYQQTTVGVMQDGDGFCCLGVLCDIAAKNGIPVERTKQGRISGWLLTQRHYDDVRRWAGLHEVMGAIVDIDGRNWYLTEHNDDGRTFVEIADAIEAQL